MRVVCGTLPGPGHGWPMLAVARALARRGHDVSFLSGTTHRDDAAAAGAQYVCLPSAGGSPLHDLRPYDDAASQAEALRPALEALSPDVVVADVITAGVALAAESMGIPFATLVVHPLHTPSRALPPFGWGGPPGRGPVGAWRDAWMRRENAKDLSRARDAFNRARVRLGLEPTDRLDATLSPHLVLVATLPSLEVERPDWPQRAHVVGPCLWETPDVPFDPPPGTEPLVLIASSTAYDGAALLEAALGAVEGLGLRGVVSTGRATHPERFPAGVTAAPGVPHASILPHASAVISNGGHGTVVRVLSAGVPLVVSPGHGDQQENAWRVERAGAGIQVRRPSPRRIGRGLARVVGEGSFRAAAGRLAAEAAATDGPGRAARLIEALDPARGAKKMEGGQVPAPLPNGGLA